MTFLKAVDKMICDSACFFSSRYPGFETGSIFSGDLQNTQINKKELRGIFGHTVRRKFKKDETIFLQGEPGDFLFIILSGRVRVINQSMEGKEVILAILGKDEIFGEMALLDGRVRSATVVAHTSTEMIALDEKFFRRLIVSKPSFFLKILGLFVERMRNSNLQIELLALRTLKERIASLLYTWGVEQNPSGINNFKLPYTHREMAMILGTSRECITRLIRELAAKKLIATNKSGIKILDLEGLRILGK